MLGPHFVFASLFVAKVASAIRYLSFRLGNQLRAHFRSFLLIGCVDRIP